jgi:hypothetical protein
MLKFPQILSKILSQDDLEYAGMRKCFTDFYELIRAKLMEDPILQKNVDEHLTEVIDYIMLRLYK